MTREQEGKIIDDYKALNDGAYVPQFQERFPKYKQAKHCDKLRQVMNGRARDEAVLNDIKTLTQELK